MLDLNGFKRINDVHGHPTGDEALVQTAIRLRKAIRHNDMVARLGGDEFAILARHLAGVEAAATLALKIIKALKNPVHTGAGEHAIGAGIGIALAPTDGADAEMLLRKADVALHRAKALGLSALRFFEEEMDHHIRERYILERDLRAAIGPNKLEVIYQPRIDLKSGAIISFEATLRWMHDQYGKLDTPRMIATRRPQVSCRRSLTIFCARLVGRSHLGTQCHAVSRCAPGTVGVDDDGVFRRSNGRSCRSKRQRA